MSKPKTTKATLEQKLFDTTSQLVFRYKSAPKELTNAGEALHASAVILHITALGGREIVAPVAILDGLSQETIDALRKDIARSFALATGIKST